MKTPAFSPSRAIPVWLWGLIVCFVLPNVFGEELVDPNVVATKRDGFLERFHYNFSNDVVKTAYWLDSFFGGTRIDEETLQSRLRVNVSLQLVKNQKSILSSDAGLKLVLPHMEDRFQFLFGGESEEEFNPDKKVSKILRDLKSTGNYSSALRYVLLATQGWDTSLDGGMKLRGHPNLFVRTRIRKSIERGNWVYRLTERLTLYEGTGVESVSSVDFDRKIRDDLFFRVTPSAIWTEEDDKWVLAPSVSVFHQWDDRRAAAFVFGVTVDTEPATRVEDYTFKVKYRQKIKGDWLFFEVVPELSYPREEDFNVVPKIQFKVEAIFGNLD